MDQEMRRVIAEEDERAKERMRRDAEAIRRQTIEHDQIFYGRRKSKKHTIKKKLSWWPEKTKTKKRK